MRPESNSTITYARTLRDHFRDGMRAARRRRPTSFYLLLITPVVLLLGLRMAQYRDEPLYFAGILTLLFLFCGVVLLLAVFDIFEISRRSLREHHNAFRETLGEEDFYRDLAIRVVERRRGE